MNDWAIWRLIKAGFWLGIGFIIPSLIVYAIGTAMIVGITPQMFEATMMEEMGEEFEANDAMSEFKSQFDKTTQVEILERYESKIGEQLLILGKIKNIGNDDVDSIQLEAELFDSEGKFVYECSEYISKRLKSEEVENFQIKCGCQGQATPAYSSLKVRVVSASSY